MRPIRTHHTKNIPEKQFLEYASYMKYMGIDFGTKRIGIAFSDESCSLALPHSVIANDKKTLQNILQLAKDKAVSSFVIGKSIDLKGEANPVQRHIDAFVHELHTVSNIPVLLHVERYSSAEAEHIQGKNHMLDASAAAIILQGFLDTQNK